MSLILATVFPRSRLKSLKHQLFFCRFLFIQGSEGKAVVTSTYRLARLVTLEKSFHIKDSCLVKREWRKSYAQSFIFSHTRHVTLRSRLCAHHHTPGGQISRVVIQFFTLNTKFYAPVKMFVISYTFHRSTNILRRNTTRLALT